jgi:hypothetical protein
MRTDAELLEFALTCEKIEKQGGDVLGYIEQEYPSYTPRATWYRLQKACLNRTAAQLTEGKPKEKGVRYMGKMMELAQGAIEAYGRGENVYDYLASQGSKNPSAYWYQIKATVKLKDPDLYEKLSVIRTDTRKKETPARKEVETIFFGGKEYEKMEGPSPTCCQPAPESGVTVPDDLALNAAQKAGVSVDHAANSVKKMAEAMRSATEQANKFVSSQLDIVAVGSRAVKNGRYQKSDIHFDCEGGNKWVHLIWRDLVTKDEKSMSLHVDDWLRLAEEIPAAMKQLGF